MILLPEIPYDLDRICEAIRERGKWGRRFTMVVMAEGAKPKGGEVTVRETIDDSPDPVRLGGCSAVLAHQIEERTGNGQRALELFESILEIESSPIEGGLTHLRIAGILEDQGEHEQALEHLKAATVLLPNRPDAYLALARLAGRTGRFDEAAAAFAQVLATDPRQQEALFGRTIALLLGGRSAEAKQHLEAALVRQPRSLPMQHALARLLATSPEVSVRDGRRAVEMAMAVFQWQKSLERAVGPNQHADRENTNTFGSWDPVGAWGEDGGRVYSTAILTLTMQANYRYTRLIR